MMGNTNYLANVRGRMRDIAARRAAAANDPILSEIGKNKKLAALDDELAGFRPLAFGYLQSEWRQIRAEHKKAQELRAQAEEVEAGRWNHERLNYEADAVRAAVRRADSFSEVAEAYSQAQASGDLHRRRAWAEIGAPEVLIRFAKTDFAMAANKLEKRARADLAALQETPDMQQAAQLERDLILRAKEAYDLTLEVGREYDPGAGMHKPVLNEFSALVGGVSIESNIDPVTFGVRYALAIEPKEDAAPEGRVMSIEEYMARRARLGLA